MSSSRLKGEEARYNSYVYPESNVYVNKFNIREQHVLNVEEDKIVRARSVTRPEFKNFTLKEMQKIHEHLLGDLYSWAGKIRDYTTGRSATSFAPPQFIESYFNKTIHGGLKNEGFLKGLPIEQFSNRAAHYASELNAVHPFIDGNGRLTRIFIEDLAKNAGYKFDRTNVEYKKGDWYDAMAHSFETNNTAKLQPLIQKALTPLELKKNLTHTPISDRPKAEYKPSVHSKGFKR